jgi:hypothetical protein
MLGADHLSDFVIAGLDPAIHRNKARCLQSGWMRGSSPRMTDDMNCERR